MKRPFRRFEVGFEVGFKALGLVALLVIGGSCTPANNVTPGAPVLTELTIIEPGPTTTTITSATGYCPADADSGGACDPTGTPVCESLTTRNICRCPQGAPSHPAPAAATDGGATDGAVADASASDAAAPVSDAGAPATSDAAVSDAASTLTGNWSCGGFAPTSTVLYVFDRLLDTVPLNPGDASGVLGVASVVYTPATPVPPVTISADYASNGSPNEVIFPLLGDLRSDGPSLLFGGQPALPAGRSITLTLDPTMVLAKDGKTPFTGANLLMDGIVTFTTAPFSVSIATPPPPPPPADAGADAGAPTEVVPDMTPVTATFNNFIDPTTIGAHITVTSMPTAGGPPAAVAVSSASMDGLTVTITPAANWPPSSTITVTVDPAVTDVVGDVLGANQPAQFTTSAN